MLVEKKITSQPVASERLLILIKGVLPIAATSPFLAFLTERVLGVFLDEAFDRVFLQRRYERSAMESAVAIALVVLSGGAMATGKP